MIKLKAAYFDVNLRGMKSGLQYFIGFYNGNAERFTRNLIPCLFNQLHPILGLNFIFST